MINFIRTNFINTFIYVNVVLPVFLKVFKYMLDIYREKVLYLPGTPSGNNKFNILFVFESISCNSSKLLRKKGKHNLLKIR